MSDLWLPPGAATQRTRVAPRPADRWVEVRNGPLRARLRAQGAVGVRFFERADLHVIVAREPADDGALRWHQSISAPDRYPTWDEIADARYDLLADDLTMAMLLPPRSEYVNRHPFCFHLHELP